MNSIDAIAVLTDAFVSDALLTDKDGFPAYNFVGDFDFCATELDDTVLRLSTPLPPLNTSSSSVVKRRLLEGSFLGAETGAGRLGTDPLVPRDVAMIDVIDLALLDEDDFKLRVINFMMHVEYWRAEGVGDILAEAAKANRDVGDYQETMIRV